MAKKSTAKRRGTKSGVSVLLSKVTSKVVDVTPETDPKVYKDKPTKPFTGNKRTVPKTSNRRASTVHYRR